VKRTHTPWLIAVIFVLIASALLFSNHLFAVNAQGGATFVTNTPLPSPTGNGGTAEWAVEEQLFTTAYPKGGVFTTKASSSAGNIKSAILYYYHNQSRRQRLTATFDEANGVWVATWDGGRTPQWVGIWFWWQFTDEQGNTFQSEISYDEYQDPIHEWNRAESDDIIVYWEKSLPEEMGQEIIDAMALRRDFYYASWGRLLGYKPRAIIFDGYATAQDWSPGTGIPQPGIGGNISTVTGGFTRQEYGAFVGFFRSNRERPRSFALGTVLHEMGHLYQFQNGNFPQGQTWFTEGNAEYNSLSNGPAMIRAAQAIAQSGNMLPLADVGVNGREAYDLGYAFWAWFLDQYGADKHLAIWQLVARGNSPQQAIEKIAGQPFIVVESTFREWLGAPNAKLEVQPTATLFSLPSPTLRPTATKRP